MHSTKRSVVRRVLWGIILGLAMAVAPPSIAEDDVPASDESDAELECSLFNFEGEASAYVDLSFTVTAEGTVRDPFVIRSDACEESAIPSFERAAINAVLDFEYRPRVVDGEAVDVEGVTTRISFRVEGEDESADEESVEVSE